MRALVFDGAVRFARDLPQPQPRRGEARVAVRLAGICSTDLEVAKGYMGFRGVMGHEFVGVVDAGPAPWRGKRVVGEINCVCGECDLCTAGLANHCRNRTVVGIDGHDGVFADYVVLPAANLHEVPAGLADEQAVFTEPLAAAFQVVRQVQPGAADTAVVLGDGRLGQLVARVLKGYVDRPLLVGKHPAKLEAAEKAGIEGRLLSEWRPDKRVDLVVEATGRPEGLATALAAVRPRGTIVLKSTFAGEAGVNLAPLVIDEVTMVGSRCGPFGEALRALAAGAVDVAPLVTGRYPLARGVEALEAARGPEAIKVLLDVAG